MIYNFKNYFTILLILKTKSINYYSNLYCEFHLCDTFIISRTNFVLNINMKNYIYIYIYIYKYEWKEVCLLY